MVEYCTLRIRLTTADTGPSLGKRQALLLRIYMADR